VRYEVVSAALVYGNGNVAIEMLITSDWHLTGLQAFHQAAPAASLYQNGTVTIDTLAFHRCSRAHDFPNVTATHVCDEFWIK
jgi:hypothetical protein